MQPDHPANRQARQRGAESPRRANLSAAALTLRIAEEIVDVLLSCKLDESAIHDSSAFPRVAIAGVLCACSCGVCVRRHMLTVSLRTRRRTAPLRVGWLGCRGARPPAGRLGIKRRGTVPHNRRGRPRTASAGALQRLLQIAASRLSSSPPTRRRRQARARAQRRVRQPVSAGVELHHQ
jgi:hypothetical protein